MEIGMLWYDDGPAKLKERVQRAAEYYADKYGRKPNLCLVNPGMLVGEAGKVNGVQVRSAAVVMPGHLWIGVEQAAKSNGGAAKLPAAKRAGSGTKGGSKNRASRGNKKKAD